MVTAMNDYPLLEQLMCEYLHRDYDLITGSHNIEDVIDVYLEETCPQDLHNIIIEINYFTSSYQQDLDNKFECILDPDIPIQSAAEFLNMVSNKVKARILRNGYDYSADKLCA